MFEERAPAEKKIDQSTIRSSEPAALGFEWDAKDVEHEKKNSSGQRRVEGRSKTCNRTVARRCRLGH